MSSAPMIFAIPSKGRLKDQVEAWLAECGFKLEMTGGARGYSAELAGLPGVSVRLLSAGDIAAGLDSGDLHLGVTGEDLLRERGDDMDSRVMLLRALGFGRADLVVTAPKSWLDVDTMADIDEVGHAHLAKTGRRLRVATKYVTQTRAFFARHGVADYRIVESSGATEGAPAAGAAELVVDITTTGATLAANGLKILSDGVILKSQAQLTASLIADWSAEQLDSLKRLLSVVEAKGRAGKLATLVWPAEQDAAGQAAVAAFVAKGGSRRANGALLATGDLFDAAAALAAAGVEPVTVSRPDYVFESRSAVLGRFADALGDVLKK
ncbi:MULTISPECIES: ATP phosphoribosyltransferase [unclassified Caulobacter]|uniref:ATP phosphoribosyltransferase n=1 Tax=unclassified Caulobacter TaxID=2648921 RepID=UPI0006FD032A|nr:MULTISPECIES: ATP phosphoribosyltransferase [unclassified Caulobacter]KQV62432.1 ATP phosphoribosyltransferase [Caulobacter sp. Root342]KQV65558.1 ATP phosphoribosyltransferase [Caulobacter sp. Root343]